VPASMVVVVGGGDSALCDCKGDHLGRYGSLVCAFGNPHGGEHGVRRTLPLRDVVSFAIDDDRVRLVRWVGWACWMLLSMRQKSCPVVRDGAGNDTSFWVCCHGTANLPLEVLQVKTQF
jgi:hypothetical protein